MVSGKRLYQVQRTLVVGTHSGETPVPSSDQPSPPTILRHDHQSNQAGTNSSSPTSTTSAHMHPVDLSVAGPMIPTPLVLAQVPGPAVGGAGGRRADAACTDCRKKMTKAALWRHRTHSCSAKARKRQYACQSCPKSYTRLDALKRHLKTCPGRSLRAPTPSASSSSSGSSGVPNTDFPVLPQTFHALNLLESFSTPITPTPAGGSLSSRVQPQSPFTHHADYNLYTTYHELCTDRGPSHVAQYDHSQPEQAGKRTLNDGATTTTQNNYELAHGRLAPESPRHVARGLYTCCQETTGYNGSPLPHQLASWPAPIQDHNCEPDRDGIQEAAVSPDARFIGINSWVAHLLPDDNSLRDPHWS